MGAKFPHPGALCCGRAVATGEIQAELRRSRGNRLGLPPAETSLEGLRKNQRHGAQRYQGTEYGCNAASLDFSAQPVGASIQLRCDAGAGR